MRTTTPDQYSLFVRDLARRYRLGEISPSAFGTLINLVWKRRGNA